VAGRADNFERYGVYRIFLCLQARDRRSLAAGLIFLLSPWGRGKEGGFKEFFSNTMVLFSNYMIFHDFLEAIFLH
jgi:hypothetical protein